MSSSNPAYNPLAYQLGSVWPFDTALIAAGLWRYGFREEAGILLRSLLEAAARFEEERLPEALLRGGSFGRRADPLRRGKHTAGLVCRCPLLAAQLFLGVLPYAPRGRCFLSPWLPEWLPELELSGIAVGQTEINIKLTRRGNETLIDRIEGKGLEIVRGLPEAPLWGEPMDAQMTLNRVTTCRVCYMRISPPWLRPGTLSDVRYRW